MKLNKFNAMFLLLLLLPLSGCLKVSKMTFTIKLDTDSTGTCTIEAFNIMSDAVGNKEFEDDKSIITDMLDSRTEFLEYLQSFEKEHVSNEIIIKDAKLNGKAVYKFKDITQVEGLKHDKEFYYMTRPLTDSITTSNGAIVPSGEFKRIMWSKKTSKVIQFDLYDNSESNKRDLVKYYQDYLKSKK